MFMHSSSNRVTLDRDEVFECSVNEGKKKAAPVQYVTPSSVAYSKYSKLSGGEESGTGSEDEIDDAVTQAVPAPDNFTTPRKRKAVSDADLSDVSDGNEGRV